MGDVDLATVFPARAKISIDPEEAPEALSVRLKREAQTHTLDLLKQYFLFGIFVVLFVAIAVGCFYETFWHPEAPAEKQRWAMTILSSLFTGLISFIVGQMTVRRT